MTENELVDKLASALWDADEGPIKNRYMFERYLRYSKALLPLIRSYTNALVAAAVEACAVFVQDNEGHDPECPWFYSPDDGHVDGCTCEAKELANNLRSAVTPAEAQAELEHIKNAARLEGKKEILAIIVKRHGIVFGSKLQRDIDDVLKAAARKKKKDSNECLGKCSCGEICGISISHTEHECQKCNYDRYWREQEDLKSNE